MTLFATVTTLVHLVELASEAIPLLIRQAKQQGEMSETEAERLLGRLKTVATRIAATNGRH